MAKNTRPFSGQMQRKYFRDLLKSDPGISPEAVERLTEIASVEIASIRVRLPLVIRKRAAQEIQAAVQRAGNAKPSDTPSTGEM